MTLYFMEIVMLSLSRYSQFKLNDNSLTLKMKASVMTKEHETCAIRIAMFESITAIFS